VRPNAIVSSLCTVLSDDERVAHLSELRALPSSDWPTRDRILYEAARLIAANGYHGASTRDITMAVGIRQPSLFNHFASKQQILAELLRFEVSIPAERAEAFARSEDRPVTRLYRYMLWDFDWYGEMPFDLRGMQEELLGQPGLEGISHDLARWKRAINGIVRDGVALGEFHKDSGTMITTVLTGLSWEIVRMSQHGQDRRTARRQRAGAAAFVLRGLLRDPDEVAEIVRAETRSRPSRVAPAHG
jgi:AcrR family transcriptional regulator